MLFRICVQPIFIILLIWHNYSAPLQQRCNWCQPPLTAARRPSRFNGGDPILAPANVGPNIPPPSHPRPISSIRHIQPVASQFPHTSQLTKIQFLRANPRRPIPIQFSQYDTSNNIQMIQTIWSSHISSEGNPPKIPSLIINTHPQLPQLPQNIDFILRLLLIPPHLIFHPPQQPMPPDICSLPLLRNIMLPSLLQI